MKLCLFAMWSPTHELLNFRKIYLRELKHCADYTIVISSGELIDADKKFLYDQQIDLIVRENAGLDFGSWKAGLDAVGNLAEFEQLLLVNDSCIPIRDFAALAKWIDGHTFDYFGITSSRSIALHVQSYFLGIRPAAYGAVKSHFNRFGIMRTSKPEIIRKYEVGLSQVVRQHGLQMGAMYPHDISPVIINPACVAAPLLLRHGCPILKRQIAPVFAKYLQPYCDFDVDMLLDGVCPTNQPGFDEDWYLQEHPGVQNLIKLKRYSCGFEHYLRLPRHAKANAMINQEKSELGLTVT